MTKNSYTIPEGAPPLRPRQAQVMLRLLPAESKETTESGLFIPESMQKAEIRKWEIVAVGEGVLTQNGLIPCVSKPGQIVILKAPALPARALSYMEEYGFKDYAIVNETDIFADIVT